MKYLQLFKHIASQITKDYSIHIGLLNSETDYITDGYIVWLIPNYKNPFKYMRELDNFDKVINDINYSRLEKINNFITLNDENLFDGKTMTRGILKGNEFYFNPDFLKYFDKKAELFKDDIKDTAKIYIKESGDIVGFILPIYVNDKTKEEINNKLGL